MHGVNKQRRGDLWKLELHFPAEEIAERGTLMM